MEMGDASLSLSPLGLLRCLFSLKVGEWSGEATGKKKTIIAYMKLNYTDTESQHTGFTFPHEPDVPCKAKSRLGRFHKICLRPQILKDRTG